ncbi:mitochondrial 54S ribosomal protein mL58 MRPL20 [Rhodotorula paludigena]|uniref:mitochondrial 54S ribosomal protein mL58 MRPL20 n=1 Tax=Rhodotorula paludigena TaxID=86838 RepID=UPI00316DB2B5
MKRAFAATSAVCKQLARASSGRLARTRDPLLSSALAHHFSLDDGSHFVARPPPSVLPPTVPVPATSASPALAAALANSPFASAVAPSPLGAHLAPAQGSTAHLLPPLRAPPVAARATLSPADVAELQQLRRSRPTYWTRSRLAAKFGVTQQVVGTLGWGEGPEARRAERERRDQVERRADKREAQYGWKKQIAREERQRRRSMW